MRLPWDKPPFIGGTWRLILAYTEYTFILRDRYGLFGAFDSGISVPRRDLRIAFRDPETGRFRIHPHCDSIDYRRKSGLKDELWNYFKIPISFICC